MNYVQLLQERLAEHDMAVVNDGVNGDLAYNALQRLDQVIGGRPDVVTVLIGTNDANASLSDKNARMMTRMKRLPVAPTVEWYRDNLAGIARRLSSETSARVAFLSVPVLGEVLDSEPVRRSAQYSAVVRDVADQFGCTYLPLHERQVTYLRDSQQVPGTYYSDGLGLSSRASLQHFVLRRSLDSISRRRGLQLTTDTIHQNTTGALLIADLIEAFVREGSPPEGSQWERGRRDR